MVVAPAPAQASQPGSTPLAAGEASPAPTQPAPAPERSGEPPICYRFRTRCDVRALEGCNVDEDTRLAIIDELAQCASEATVSATRTYYRASMLDQGFRDGALRRGAGGHLVRAGVLTDGQAKTLANVAAEVKRALAGRTQQYRAIDPGSCRLVIAADGEVALDCRAAGGCALQCHQRFFVATLRVEVTGVRVKRLSEELVDTGACGCCM